ncbi:hypothetical protein SAMN05216241_103112 [Limimonas halophila]|uniref:DUF2065 domain-containing protein n=1 Tax=Limimonas halophila TaxID=1082479 RepID=A0A1G7PWX3_9PROT|nr:DUF2065 domain-containing protein [Limimonas halophila]SDF90741.1 hypothetical protein SAMN05216241_103112 [Limimonas halophila]
MALDLADFVTALGLVLVFEGVALALLPSALRRALETLDAMPREAMRWGGLLVALAGVFVLYLVRG